MMNISRETKMSMILCSIQSKSSSPFLSPGYVFSMFLNFEHFQPRVFKKEVLIEKKKSMRLLFDGLLCFVYFSFVFAFVIKCVFNESLT